MSRQDFIEAREMIFRAMQVAPPLGQGILQGVNRYLMEQRLVTLRKGPVL